MARDFRLADDPELDDVKYVYIDEVYKYTLTRTPAGWQIGQATDKSLGEVHGHHPSPFQTPEEAVSHLRAHLN
jgi:hypothetical protein